MTVDEMSLFWDDRPIEVLDLAVQDGLREGVEASIVGQRCHRHYGLVQARQELDEVLLENLKVGRDLWGLGCQG